MARLIVVSGTGTEIGKTHTTCAILRAAPASTRVVGLKPIESGVEGDEGDDARALRLASSSMFHVKHTSAPYLLRRPISPHLAAREEGKAIELGRIVDYVNAAASTADVVFVELAGGLFSPLAPGLVNADAALALCPDAVLLVAPDRLGVLHDVTACLRALGHDANRITAIGLVAPAQPDSSTGTNAAELAWLGAPPVRAIPRGPQEALASSQGVRELYALLTESPARSS